MFEHRSCNLDRYLRKVNGGGAYLRDKRGEERIALLDCQVLIVAVLNKVEVPIGLLLYGA